LVFLLKFRVLLQPTDAGVMLFNAARDLVVLREHGASDVVVGVAGIAVRFGEAEVYERRRIVGGVVGCGSGKGLEQLAGGVGGHRNP